MAKRKGYTVDEPLAHSDHRRPRTRRDLICQGFLTGAGTLAGFSALNLISRRANAALSNDLAARLDECGIREGSGKVPFICFDLAGGANFAGSNVLVGGAGGQEDYLSTAGYSKQGLPGDMLPGQNDPNGVSYTDSSLGLRFHSDSQLLAGIRARCAGPEVHANTNGAVFAARSENDTGNNPHNPMYAIALAGPVIEGVAQGPYGGITTLIGSRASESGGNSMAPLSMMNSEIRPTKVDRPSDVTGLVQVPSFDGLNNERVVRVMEAVSRLSNAKMGRVNPGYNDLVKDRALQRKIECAYVESAHLADKYGADGSIDPSTDPLIIDQSPDAATGIFAAGEFDGGGSNGEYRKTASIMKMVIDGYAAAGTVTMGGYDYHTGDRVTGEARDFRAGECIGACLEYAARKGQPLMIYVFSDGSVFSNGSMDGQMDIPKGVWTGDSQQTASSFFLVYNPNGRPELTSPARQQIGHMRPSGDVETSSSPCANNVNLLVQTVMLNYMALNGEQQHFAEALASYGIASGLGSGASLDQLIAFNAII